MAADADRFLPYHASAKKIPTVDADGRPFEPSEPNGRKFERFVFDALPVARSTCVVETSRSEEFSPVKNAEGVDSPESARRDLVALYRSWLAAADAAPPEADSLIEIDHAVIDGPDDAQRLGVQGIEEARDAVRVAPPGGGA